MSNSSLVSYTRISPNRTQGREGSHIDTISIHHMAGNLTIEQCGEVFAPSSRKASSNYGVGSDGRVGMYVEEKDRSWCTSSAANDRRAVTIEVANDGSSPDWHVSDKAIESLVKLCADICRRNGIPKLMWKNDKSLIGQVDKQNMTVHMWFKDKVCPGPYLLSKHVEIAKKVNDLLGVPYDSRDYVVPQSIGSITLPVSSTSPSYPDYIEPVAQVDATKIHPYIATIPQDFITIDCNRLKAADVVGLLLYGGSYYTDMHLVKSSYNAPNIKKQTECADKHDIPYGLNVHVRARSVVEAKAECNELWYLVSKYPPKLGVWLTLQTSVSTSIKDAILEHYYRCFEKWGLKGKCGLYISKSMLNTISWNSLSSKYLLWLVDHVSSMDSVDDNLLDPEFFDV